MEATSLPLREVQRPSALSRGGFRRFLRMLWVTAKTDWQLRFQEPVLGYVWTLLGPLLLFAVLYIAFTRFVRFGGEIQDYPALLLFNIMLFFVFSQGTGRAVNSFVAKQNVIGKVEFPLLAIPFSCVLSSLFALALNMLVVFTFMLVTGIEVRWTWLLFPLIVAGFVAVTAAFALLLSSAYVRYRDTGEIWTPIGRMMFYATPVLFPVEFFPPSWHFLLYLNPLAPILIQARVWLIDPSAPTYTEAVGGGIYLVLPVIIFLAILAAGIVAFRRLAPLATEI